MSEDRRTIVYAKEQVERMNAARRFPDGTTPACRHVAMMAEALSKTGEYPTLTQEPRHCAGSMAATVEMLWTARAALAEKDAEIARLREAIASVKSDGMPQ